MKRSLTAHRCILRRRHTGTRMGQMKSFSVCLQLAPSFATGGRRRKAARARLPAATGGRSECARMHAHTSANPQPHTRARTHSSSSFYPVPGAAPGRDAGCSCGASIAWDANTIMVGRSMCVQTSHTILIHQSPPMIGHHHQRRRVAVCGDPDAHHPEEPVVGLHCRAAVWPNRPGPQCE